MGKYSKSPQNEFFLRVPYISRVNVWYITTLSKRLGVVGELEFRLPITEANDCNIADVLFINQICNVNPGTEAK